MCCYCFGLPWTTKCFTVCGIFSFICSLGTFSPYSENTGCSSCNIQISWKRKEMLLQLWGNSSDNYLIWNWLCSFICTQQTTLYLQTDILFRGTITVQRLLGGKIHVFHTAVGIKLLCGCLINNNWVKGTSSLLSGIVIIFYYYYFFSVQTHYLSVHESKFF